MRHSSSARHMLCCALLEICGVTPNIFSGWNNDVYTPILAHTEAVTFGRNSIDFVVDLRQSNWRANIIISNNTCWRKYSSCCACAVLRVESRIIMLATCDTVQVLKGTYYILAI